MHGSIDSLTRGQAPTGIADFCGSSSYLEAMSGWFKDEDRILVPVTPHDGHGRIARRAPLAGQDGQGVARVLSGRLLCMHRCSCSIADD